MRALLGCVLALGLAVSPAIAGPDNAAGSDSANSTNSTSESAGKNAASVSVAAKAKADSPSLESELEEVRDLIASQSRQIADQNEQLKAEQDKLRSLEEQLKASAKPVSLTSAPTTAGVSGTATVSASVPAASSRAGAPAAQAIPDSPLQFHLGGAYFTPLGFMDFTGVGRTTNAGNGIGSNFGSIPYPFTSGATPPGINLLDHATEARLSIQNSRVGFRVDALVKGAHVIGYLEADFLGNNAGSVAVTSNSNTLRSRLYWVDLSKGQWELLAGQTWSLITPGRTGISPLPGNIFYSQDVDVNYQAGLVWGRIPEIRLVWHPSAKVAAAIALDNQEQYDGGSGGGPSVTLPTGGTVVAGVSALPGTQLNNGTTTVSAPQIFPDVIAKLAFDPSSRFHAEVGGVERQFRVTVNSTTSATSPVVKQGMTGGGVFINGSLELFKGFRVLTNNYWSEAGGRYIFGLVPDVVVNPNGSLSAIEASSTVDGFEFTHKNTLFYAYYGGVYVNRNVKVVNGLDYGYGVHATGSTSNFANAISQNRAIQEETVGINQTIWRNPRYGALNLMGQYSYESRDPWSVAVGAPSRAALSIAFVNLRYTLPGAPPSTNALQ